MNSKTKLLKLLASEAIRFIYRYIDLNNQYYSSKTRSPATIIGIQSVETAFTFVVSVVTVLSTN
uniref:Uncharacterized protein n=1 Tax=Glossina pallidipes TaxID=7398 RepID=A0A1A9ZW85_GLOPL